jgi:glutathione peroxidase
VLIEPIEYYEQTPPHYSTEIMSTTFYAAIAVGIIALALIAMNLSSTPPPAYAGQRFHEFTMKGIDGKDVALSQFKGKVVLVVNVASECGYTKQYDGLEKLYKDFKDKGFVILGVPSNDFGGQEPGSDSEIQQFCRSKFGVTFPMLSKVTVKGESMTPLYQFLTSGGGNENMMGNISWNFEKFLISKNGEIINRYKSRVAPESAELRSAIEQALKQ